MGKQKLSVYSLLGKEMEKIYEAGTRSEQQSFWGHLFRGRQPLSRPWGTAGVQQGAELCAHDGGAEEAGEGYLVWRMWKEQGLDIMTKK